VGATENLMMAAALAKGTTVLDNAAREPEITDLAQCLSAMGVAISGIGTETLTIQGTDRLKAATHSVIPDRIETGTYAMAVAMTTRAQGASMITETIFESRFMHVPELARMGANVTIHHESALVRGVPKLRGADVMATDLRASVSLAIAGLAAEGETTLHRVYHLDRGYERLEQKLAACGADIQRLKG